MNRKKQILIMILEVAVLILVRCLARQSSEQGFSILSYPFVLLADLLGAQASAGTFGSGLAAALWIGISILPAAAALRKGAQSIGLPERLALFFLSLTLAVCLYGMAVPAKIWPRAAELGAEAETVVRYVLVSAICSAAILWFVLYLIRRFRSGGWDGLLRSAGVLSCVICVFLTAAVAIAVSDCVLSIAETKQIGFEAAVTILRCLVQIIPMILNVAVLLRGMELLVALRDADEASIVPAAEHLSRICCIALGLSAALQAAFNLVQVVFARCLSNVSVNAEFSLTGLALTVLVLLFARMVIENKKLRDDNSLFI